MISVGTTLTVIDNSGARKVKCLKIYKFVQEIAVINAKMAYIVFSKTRNVTNNFNHSVY